MVNPPQDRVLVSIDGSEAQIRVVGRGSLNFGPPMRDFIQLATARGVTSALVDLSQCENLDSTFLGLLAGLATRLRQRGGQVCVAGANERITRVMTTLGLDRCVTFVPGAARVRGSSLADLNRVSGREAASAVLEAHETLAELDPENRERFRDVIEFVREQAQPSAGGEVVSP